MKYDLRIDCLWRGGEDEGRTLEGYMVSVSHRAPFIIRRPR